ncbi:MAG TPA: hypothetical protein VEJ86_08270, partial [Candidatus Binataceae bacterium]|nr:hypothetical protein [Candidatus Binataceae bacterium]
GAYPVPLDGIVGALVLGCIAIRRRSYFPILALMSFALFAAGFAAIKLVPTFALMRTHPRPWESADANTVAMMLRFLFARDQGIYPEGTWGIEGSWEYGAYIGVIAAALAIVGVARSPRRALPWVVVCVFCFAVAMGKAGLEFPWIWLHRLPLMSAERVPSRFLIGVVLGVAILAASGAELVQQGFGRFCPRVVLLLLVAMLVDFWSVSAPTLIHAVDGKLEVVPLSPEFRQIFQLAPDRTYPLALANYGSAVCFNIQEFPTAVVGYNVGRGYPGEQYLKTPGSLTRLKWSPNELSYEVDVAIPSAVIVNQNYDSGWRVVEGRGRVYRSGNLLAIEVPAGRQRLTIRNRDPYLPIGAAVSALTLLMALWLMRLERRRHRVAQPSVAV